MERINTKQRSKELRRRSIRRKVEQQLQKWVKEESRKGEEEKEIIDKKWKNGGQN